MELISEVSDVPVIGPRSTCALGEIFAAHGYDIPMLVESDSDAAALARKEGRYVWVTTPTERQLSGEDRATKIVVSAFATRPADPVVVYSANSYRVALSAHATFSETLRYIEQTSASVVIADNSRGNHAYDLAIAVRERLNIEATAEAGVLTRAWGR